MPWKESGLMNERLKFVGRLLEGEKMAELCREFGISRKTGYKFWSRYRTVGLFGLTDRVRKPYRYANQLPMQVEQEILRIKRDKPSWGAPKIREILKRRYPEVQTPAKSTIHCILHRHGLVKQRKRYRPKLQGTPLVSTENPNDLWCADYKGEFTLGDRRYCYPLTITDYSSRYLLACEALDSVAEPDSFDVFERTFKEFGLPKAIRTDNGVPFSSPCALFGLSRLSIWWLKLGISIERIKPGNPQENGRHERMHLTLKQEATRPAADNLLQQQERFESFINEFNTQRPHQALNMKFPSELYTPSPRLYKGAPEVTYPFHDRTATVTHCGRICIGKLKIHFSTVFDGQDVGLLEVQDGIWLVSFLDYDLGYFDETSKRFEPLPYPFAPKIV
jgi:putative transposase